MNETGADERRRPSSWFDRGGAVEVEAVARAFAPIQPRGPGRIESPSRSEDALARVRGDAGRSDANESYGGVALELSAQAVSASASAASEPDAARRPGGQGDPETGAAGSNSGSEGEEDLGPGELTPEDEEEVRRLRARDTEVRAHENAHKAAAGRHARGGPKFEFEQGPDGRRYAVGGEVQIDTSPVANDPDATILKMQQVRRAALAPAEPSSQDRKVASEASRTEAGARADKREAQQSESEDAADTGATPDTSAVGGTGESQSPAGAPAESRAAEQSLGAATAKPAIGRSNENRVRAYAVPSSSRRGVGLDLSA